MKEVLMICGLPYEIIYRDRSSRTDDNIGLCDSKDCKIYIDKDVPKAQKEATLVHEWVHGVLDCNGYYEQDEKIVSILATELYRLGFRLDGQRSTVGDTEEQ